ncbi:MAG: DMT family transporter [Eggerthellaceae bacterium]|jgi:drug/metabolite transporter (DMT)-like permease
MTQHIRGVLCSIGASVTWGLSGACVQCLTARYEIGSLELTSIRMLFAGITFLAIVAWRNHSLRIETVHDRKTVLRLAIFGIVGVFISQFAYIQAIATTNAGTATVLCCLNSVILLAAVCLTKRKAPKPIEVAAIIMALGSVWLIATGGNPENLAISPIGLAWGISAAGSIAFYTIYSKPIMASHGNIPALAIGMLFGGLTSTACSLPHWSMPQLDPFGIVLIAVVVVFGTVVTFALYFQAVLALEAVEVGSLSVVEPMVATAMSAIWLGSSFSPIDYFAFALMLAMVVLVSHAGSEPNRTGAHRISWHRMVQEPLLKISRPAIRAALRR